ncbi:MAG: Fic family protein [Methanocorpusculum sp.]|nr:Fic family protein [Methanocorpusculum sp.]
MMYNTDIQNGATFEDIYNMSLLSENGEYYSWKDLKYRVNDSDPKKVWNILKFARSLSSIHLLYDELDLFYVQTPEITRELHLCDQNLSKIISLGKKSADSLQEYISQAISEEAIFSSRLEGASTTESAAKNMLRKNIAPKNKDERMIVNNHLAMQFIRTKKDVKLTPEFICEIQKIVTIDTLKSESQSGVFRNTDDVIVVDNRTGKLIHSPPKAEKIPELIQSLCDFVNHDFIDDDEFVHPLITAIALHFLIGYIHPFYDGNGRTARTLFYWYVLSKGYEIFQYLPISKIITQSPAKYRDAYIATEEDDFDLTYFILYIIRCIRKSRKGLIEHLESENQKKASVENVIASLDDLNNRQERVLLYMIEHHNEEITIPEISGQFGVAYQTARTDLIHLTDAKYLIMRKRSREFVYSINPEWMKKIQ